MSILTKVVSKGEFDWADSDIYSCNACGAYGSKENIEHSKNCGGQKEIDKWDKYYSSQEWIDAHDQPSNR